MGKWVMGLRVIRTDGHSPGVWKGALRNFLRVVDSLPKLNILGVILVMRSAERSRFGDRVAGTKVVQSR